MVENLRSLKLRYDEKIQERDEKLKLKEQMLERLKLIKERKEVYFPEYERELLNEYIELKGNFRVFIRVRPILN